MSNAYIDINVLNVVGQSTLSSYALSATPLLFYPEYTILEDTSNSVFWDFGDGTVSNQTSAYKIYPFPGKYTVTMTLFDCDKNAITSLIQKTVVIYDLLPLTFNVSTTSLSSKCGKASDPIVITPTYPYYQSPISIFYSISGSDSSDYWELESLQYKHLDNTYNIYEKIYNYHLNGYQYNDIKAIQPSTLIEVYGKLQNGEVVICDESDVGSFYVGMSGYKEIYFKDDKPSDSIRMYLYFDKTKYTLPNNDVYLTGINNLGVTLPLSVIDNNPNYLSITSNGLDGEFYTIDSFNIFSVKYFNTLIPFVIKVKDEESYSYKNLDPIEIGDLTIEIYSDEGLLNTSDYTLSSLNYTLSSQNMGGAFRGVITFTNDTIPLTNVYFAVSALLDSGTVIGQSSQFNVYPLNYYDVYKKNENFNSESTLKDLIFQEILIDDDVLFEDFLGQIYGDDNSDHEGIYLKMYEKITNFVQNTQDLDVSEIEFLNSLSKHIGYNDINEELYSYPEKIKRLVNLLSIKYSKLFGTTNKFNENFNPKGDTSKQLFGTNLGSEISTATYVLTAGSDIVALEKFSNTYLRLNSYQPVSAINSHIYPLSAYTDDWGWPLVLPQSFNVEDFGKYYIFFECDDIFDSTLVGGVIDFENSKTTIPLSATNTELFNTGGIYDNLFLNTLYQSLSLIQ